MSTSHLIEQEQQRRSQNEYAQEVLRQIQSFGEAADDEFDVQWAASMTAKKVTLLYLIYTYSIYVQNLQKDQPNGHLPFGAEQPPLQPEIQEVQPEPKPVQHHAPQRINPFLESPDEEEGDTVTVEQVVSYF